MTLLYFDGFDMHTRVWSALDIGAGAAQDAGYYWRGGTITRYEFVEGYDEGRAFLVSSGGINAAGSQGVGGWRGRVGAWIKLGTTWFQNLITFDSTTSPRIEFATTLGGRAQILVDGVALITSPTIVIPDSTWCYIECYADGLNGIYEFSVNGSLAARSTSGPIETSGNFWSVGLSSPTLFEDNQYTVDHLWITNGDFPAGDEILGVQVVAAADRYEGNDGFKGQLVIAGERYQSAARNPVVSSQESYAEGINVVNVLNYMFVTNPATNLPWTASGFSVIDQWGLCYNQQTGDNSYVRCAGVCLAYLDYNDGMPLVKNYQASGITSFSGNWLKSDDTRTFTSLVQAVPRPTIILEEDAPSIRTNGGCILWGTTSSPPDPDILVYVGLTFAEEFREDYKDFVRVDGGTDFDSWFISGYSVLGEGNREFQNNYINVNYENVPTGKAYIQGLWDYSNNSSTGRWSMRQSLDNIGGDYMHATRRIKIRGHGKALQIKVSNKGNNPFVINGWTMLVTSNTSV